eukprot:scaffold270559_cov29-Tisochrysis_lutea.AAC.5
MCNGHRARWQRQARVESRHAFPPQSAGWPVSRIAIPRARSARSLCSLCSYPVPESAVRGVRVERHHADLEGVKVESAVGSAADRTAHVRHVFWRDASLCEQAGEASCAGKLLFGRIERPEELRKLE